jgi:hypothetical protein
LVEFGRLAQIERLKAMGWIEDEECAEIDRGLDAQAGGHRIGAATLMKSPDGRIHAVLGGQEIPVDGFRQVMIGGRLTPTLYKDGRRFAIRG